jgi:hypothetical protein
LSRRIKNRADRISMKVSARVVVFGSSYEAHSIPNYWKVDGTLIHDTRKPRQVQGRMKMIHT